MTGLRRLLVIVPTYDEGESLAVIAGRLRADVPAPDAAVTR